MREFRAPSKPIVLAACVLAAAMVILIGLMSCKPKGEAGEVSVLEKSGITFPVESRFIPELGAGSYPEAKAPRQAPVFRWDFSGKNVYRYGYEQKAENMTVTDMNVGQDHAPMKQSMMTKGRLLMKSKGNGTADLVLKNLKVIMEMDAGEGLEPRKMEQTVPPMTIQGVKENGELSLSGASQELLLRLLFPLPPESLEVGEIAQVPADMPFNAMGSLLQVRGWQRMRLARYVDIDGRWCAEIEGDIDISLLDLPEEMEGKYTCFTKGSSVFYFDIEQRCFVSGTLAMLTSFEIDAPMPDTVARGQMSKVPKRVKMAMVSDNVIRITQAR